MNTRLETARLLLRPYQQDDVDDLHRLWTNPEVRRYLLDDEMVPRAWVVEEIARTRACFETHGFGQFTLLLKPEMTFIGFCGFRFFHDPPECQLLYGLAPTYWGRGLASEAARAMIRYGFEEHGFEEIVAAADPPNKASLRVMEKIGMTYHKQVMIDGLDTIYYRLSREHYRPDEAPYRVV